MPVHGIKVGAWNKCLYKDIIELFDLLRNFDLKLSPTLFKSPAVYLLEKSNHPVYNTHSLSIDET